MPMSIRKYCKPIPASYRGKIYATAKHLGFEAGKIGTENKIILQDAIFRVENELEHRHAEGMGASRVPAVVAMRGVRNRILDHLGWNEGEPSPEPPKTKRKVNPAAIAALAKWREANFTKENP